MIAPGQVLAGKFQVERVLGQGGMGVVVAAHHLVLGQRVAIKYLLPEALVHPEAVERFLREARAAVRLRSENVGRVIDVGRFDDGAPYIVMEYLEGLDLSGYIQRSGPLPVPQVVDFILQACEAIAEAHALGIIHRDLKPANLFLTHRADGSPLIKVLDFGISKAAQAEQDFSLTRTTAVMGSPGYMSPEQLRSSRDVDVRSDIWSLGVILFELATGRQPFFAESITELALKVAMDATPVMYAPHMPYGFDAAVGRCLEKDPARRYPNVAELAAALAPYGSAGAVESAARIARVLHVALPSMPPARSTTAVGAPTTLSGATGQSAATAPGYRPRSSRGPLLAGLGVAAAAGVIALVVVLGGGQGSGGAGQTGAATSGADPSADKAAADKLAAEQAAAQAAADKLAADRLAADKAAADKAAADKLAADQAAAQAAADKAAADKLAADKAAADKDDQAGERSSSSGRSRRNRDRRGTTAVPPAEDLSTSRY
jgi:serine/threonine-protein kinase